MRHSVVSHTAYALVDTHCLADTASGTLPGYDIHTAFAIFFFCKGNGLLWTKSGTHSTGIAALSQPRKLYRKWDLCRFSICRDLIVDDPHLIF